MLVYLNFTTILRRIRYSIILKGSAPVGAYWKIPEIYNCTTIDYMLLIRINTLLFEPILMCIKTCNDGWKTFKLQITMATMSDNIMSCFFCIFTRLKVISYILYSTITLHFPGTQIWLRCLDRILQRESRWPQRTHLRRAGFDPRVPDYTIYVQVH